MLVRFRLIASFGALLSLLPAGTPAAAADTMLRQILTGPAIGGVVPNGQAVADESQFADGGPTILTVAVRDVNLPDGTALSVSLDFTVVGTIRLMGGAGALTVDLKHFAVSFDQVRVNNGRMTALMGRYFK